MSMIIGILGWFSVAAIVTIGWSRFHRQVGKAPIPAEAMRHRPAA
jgi:hypothetical protein